MINARIQDCPCGSKQSFDSCCGQFITYSQYPDTAEQLMRSRYSAYVLKNENYLLKSWHESSRPESLELNNDSPMPGRAEQVKVMLDETRSSSTVQWKKLKIIFASENTVHFVAFFSESINGIERLFTLYEESTFIKNPHWQYLEGNNLKITELTKNMGCPCLSGKKFKRCCANSF